MSNLVAESISHLYGEINRLIAECSALKTRQQGLLATIVRLTNETPFPDEINGWTEQRAKLVSEVGSLRSRVADLERQLGIRSV